MKADVRAGKVVPFKRNARAKREAKARAKKPR